MSQEIDNHVTALYKIKKKIGSGAYGHVFLVQQRKTKSLKALKKNFDAFSNSTDAQRVYRQIMFLRQLDYPNIIKLQKVMKANNNIDIYLVFEHMDTDLHHVIRMQGMLQQKHKKYIIYQICKAIYYLHNSDIIHRDLKPSNVLLNQQCEAKLCDFGLVRLLQQPAPNQMAILTDYIATRWYRAPQLLLGCHNYSKQIDIWSLGCMIGQLIRGRPLFQGTSTINQIQKILNWTGIPSMADIRSMKVNINQAIMDVLQTRRRVNRIQILGSQNQLLLDLISKCLQFDPSKRIKIQQALKHPYLSQFYDAKQFLAIKKTNVNLKLHMNDNTKLSVKDYRNLIYNQFIQNSKSSLLTSPLEINLQMISFNHNKLNGNNNLTTQQKDQQTSNIPSRTSVTRQQKNNLPNKKNSTSTPLQTSTASTTSKDRNSISQRKKGISLCSKQIQRERDRQGKHNRSVMATVTMYSCSNQKYKKISYKDNKLGKKNQQVKKKTSLNTFVSSAGKMKSSYSGLPI